MYKTQDHKTHTHTHTWSNVCKCSHRHSQSDLVMYEYPMEIREGGETEEDVDDIGGELDALLPVISQNSCQCQEQRL